MFFSLKLSFIFKDNSQKDRNRLLPRLEVMGVIVRNTGELTWMNAAFIGGSSTIGFCGKIN